MKKIIVEKQKVMGEWQEDISLERQRNKIIEE